MKQTSTIFSFVLIFFQTQCIVAQVLKSDTTNVDFSADTIINKSLPQVNSKIPGLPKTGFFDTGVNKKRIIDQSYKTRLNKKLGKKPRLPKPTFGFNLKVRSESYATNAQNPLLRNELAYGRLYLTPTFRILGVPFSSNFFFTTESNNTYSNRFFAIRLDVNEMKRNIKESLEKEIAEARKLDRLRDVEMKKTSSELEKSKSELDKLKSTDADFNSYRDKLETKLKSERDEYLSNKRNELMKDSSNWTGIGRDRLEDRILFLKDSIERSNKGKLSDSLSKKNANLVTMDSNSRKKYIELQQKLTELEDKYSEIQSLRVSDSILLSDKLNKEKDPKKILEDIGSSASGFKL